MNFWSNLNLLKDVFLARLTRKNIPFAVQFSVTSRCNSRCNYCYAKYYQRNLPELDTQTIKKIITQLVELGTKRLSLVGGEPLLRQDISQIINFAKSLGLECAMTTNGYLLPSLIDKVKNIDLLVFSLDGREKNHDAGRERGSWKKTMKGLKLAYKFNIPIQVSTVLTNKNLNDLRWLADLGKKYHFQIAFTPLITQTTYGEKNPIYKLLPTDNQYRKIFQKIINFKNKGAPFLFHQKVYKANLFWPTFIKDKFLGEKPKFKHIVCQAGKYTALIDSNGDLYPCPQLVDVIKVKNIPKDGLLNAWQYINNHQCYACCMPCSNNLSLIFSLDIEVLYDLWRSYKQK